MGGGRRGQVQTTQAGGERPFLLESSPLDFVMETVLETAGGSYSPQPLGVALVARHPIFLLNHLAGLAGMSGEPPFCLVYMLGLPP